MKSRFKEMQVTLSNPQEECFFLNYEIRQSEAAQLWAERLQLAIPMGLKENDRFDNFPNQQRGNLEYLLISLNENIKSLKTLHPDLNFPALDPNDIQASVNELHFNFAHSHHVEIRINKENESLWSEFNVLLHAIETLMTNKRCLEAADLNFSSVSVTWNQPHSVAIPDECYKDFVLSNDFGCAYANYSQVGRHFVEMFRAQDDQLADEHIHPSRVISGEAYLYFGPTLGHNFSKSFREQIRVWFEARKERFNRLGHYWGDPKLALGRIPVARLANPLYSNHEIDEFVHQLSNFSIIKKITVN